MAQTIAQRAITVDELDGLPSYSFSWGLLPTGIALLGMILVWITQFILSTLGSSVFSYGYGPGYEAFRYVEIYAYTIVWALNALIFFGIAFGAYRAALRLARPSQTQVVLAWVLTPIAIALTAGAALIEYAGYWLAAGSTFEEMRSRVLSSFDWTVPVILLTAAASAFAIEVALRGLVMGGLRDTGRPMWLALLAAIGFQVFAGVFQVLLSSGTAVLHSMSYGGGDLSLLTGRLPAFAGVIVSSVLLALVLGLLRWITNSMTACVIAATVATLGATYPSAASQAYYNVDQLSYVRQEIEERRQQELQYQNYDPYADPYATPAAPADPAAGAYYDPYATEAAPAAEEAAPATP